MESSAQSTKTWGRDIWEEKGKFHTPAQVVFGTGFSERQVNAQTAQLMGFIESAFLKALPEGAKILDIGVGPLARFAIEFAKRGYQVTGLDVAESSLASARSISQGQGVAIELVNQDILEMNRPGEFDGLFCVETFFHLPAHLTLDAFRVFNSSLRKGGESSYPVCDGGSAESNVSPSRISLLFGLPAAKARVRENGQKIFLCNGNTGHASRSGGSGGTQRLLYRAQGRHLFPLRKDPGPLICVIAPEEI